MERNYSKPTSSKMLDRMRMNPALTWLSDMVKILTTNAIKIPKDYRGQVLEVKKLLDSDISGMVNSVLDFSIDASLVDYQVNAKNKNLTKKLNLWLDNINLELRGSVPVGVQALAKEYFRERWKGSSFLLLRTFWEEKDGFYIPTIMYFIDGEDIIVTNKNNTRNLNGKSYRLRISNTESKPIGLGKNEKLFIQRPYSPWGVEYSIPFLIQRGIYKNLKFLELLEEKGEFVVGKALEYLLLFKKGSEGLTLSNNPDFIYSEEDLTKVKTDFSKFIADRKMIGGASVYATNFDTELEHVIPEYARALKQELYSPIEKRIMAGLGLVDIVQGLTSTRRESVLNPKPLFSEIKTGIKDFKMLLVDIMSTIAEENSDSHRKYFRQDIKISSSVVKEELTDKMITQYRSAHDRGAVSKRTYNDILGLDLDIEIERIVEEKKFEDELYPPVIQNQEQLPDENVTNKDKKNNKDKKKDEPLENEDVPEDKKSIEKKNFNQSDTFGEPEDPRKEFEQAPYTKDKYPSQLKALPSGARNIWINTFNSVFKETNNEDNARMAAWRNVKIVYKKSDDKWVKRSKGELEKSFFGKDIKELIELKELEILGKKNKLLDRLLEEKSDE